MGIVEWITRKKPESNRPLYTKDELHELHRDKGLDKYK